MISFNSINHFALTNLYKTEKRMGIVNQRLSTGLRINSAADDPAAMGKITRLKTTISGYNVGNENIKEARSLLEYADSTASQLESIVNKMYDLAVQAEGASDTEKDNLDIEFQDLKQQYKDLVSLADFGGTNLLDGTETAGVTINTGNGTVTITGKDLTATTVGDGTTTLDSLAIDSASMVTIDNVKSALVDGATNTLDTIANSRAHFGAKLNALDFREDANNSMVANLEKSRSRIEDADMAKAMSEMTSLQIMQQSNLQLLLQYDQIKSNMMVLLQR